MKPQQRIEILEKELAALKAELLEPVKWSPKVYISTDAYSVDADNTVYGTRATSNKQKYAKAGNLYPTKEAAQKAADLDRPLKIINQLCREENERTGFVPNYSDETQEKFFFIYNVLDEKYYPNLLMHCMHMGHVPVNPESADKIVGILNSGKVEGL